MRIARARIGSGAAVFRLAASIVAPSLPIHTWKKGRIGSTYRPCSFIPVWALTKARIASGGTRSTISSRSRAVGRCQPRAVAARTKRSQVPSGTFIARKAR